MCGIVGFVGREEAAPILLDGLRRLEYRGYDSAGIAVFDPKDGLQMVKTKGRIQVLADHIAERGGLKGTIGLGHTRWATHGVPSDVNAHPHMSENGRIAVVHNGIIENYVEIKEFLQSQGVHFTSETDTEVVAQLLEYYYDGNILDTVTKVLHQIRGSYGLGVLCADCPDRLIAARKDSPLILGFGKGFHMIASDVTAVIKYTRDVCYLDDGEIAEITADQCWIYDSYLRPVEKEHHHVDWEISAAEKGGYEHFMLKEIMEQPKAIHATISPRIRDGQVVLDGLDYSEEYLWAMDKIYIIACGSSYHVGMAAKYVLEKYLRKPVEVALASEFRYSEPIVTDRTLALVISQSGETIDTLAALREAKRLGARILSIVNVMGSTIARESDDVLYTWAGPEIAVATTKAYSTQLAVVDLICLSFARKLGTISAEEHDTILAQLQSLPEKLEEVLEQREQIQYLASIYFNHSSVFFIGRNLDYAVGMEGSLKLKEISYLHSEAYAAGELKHGTISLIEQGTLVIALASYRPLFEKTMSNVVEVKSRGAKVLGLTTEPLRGEMEKVADQTITVPEVHPMLLPSLDVVPMQLFAYYVALMHGCDIDKPRNLAKSVTVE
ncbi:glutamine--fructose-6-phosphate transaminase (isomerizing) [Pseudoflavonifractor sp. MSJ-37]|uniref:glutamine--fructose-6-phosphate transaminase (isomerizing) n=1 Tax=Pseudoflavonifractor sp. MSJ-37 TaxID=2841531 RepID=UPI001C11E410|nr:glutamine--fructose-6-phosphate transaminase (isomerizing) [Pseudoflavonifractor sp. MSJ-37]MBU5434148.1 glutamine--fructose-6-phosphate transaminase (isomerizing) [Pseudoflavonifractor sp. MSJ-37]